MFKGYIEGYYSRRLPIDAFKDLKTPISHYFYGPKEDIYLRHRWKELDKNLNLNLDKTNTNENKDLSLENENNGGVNFVSTKKNSDITQNGEEQPKVVIYHKSGKSMKFSPPGIGVDGLTKEEAKAYFLELHNKHPDLNFDEEHDYEALEIVLHDKFRVNTSSIQVDAPEEFIKNMKKDNL